MFCFCFRNVPSEALLALTCFQNDLENQKLIQKAAEAATPAASGGGGGGGWGSYFGGECGLSFGETWLTAFPGFFGGAKKTATDVDERELFVVTQLMEAQLKRLCRVLDGIKQLETVCLEDELHE